MKKEIFSNPSGKLIKIFESPNEEYSFVPDLLPPKIEIPNSIIEKIHITEREVARFDGMISSLLDPSILTQPLKYDEVQNSSDLEGTTVDLVNIVAYEIDPKSPKSKDDPRNDAREVSNLKNAINYWEDVQNKLPLSLRVIREFHKLLLEGVRGKEKNPGEFRRGQIQIGNGRFVPPPANEILPLLDNLEKWINEQKVFQHPLLKSIITHYQFETIHPFNDGNGRVGRLLFSIMISQECNMISQPLFMSSFFNQFRSNYYDFLHNISTRSDWLAWIDFCLTGIETQANRGKVKYVKLQLLQNEYIKKIGVSDKSGRLRKLIDYLFITPAFTVKNVMDLLELQNWQPARKLIQELEDLDIIKGVFIEGDRKQYFISREIIDVIFSR